MINEVRGLQASTNENGCLRASQIRPDIQLAVSAFQQVKAYGSGDIESRPSGNVSAVRKHAQLAVNFFGV